MIDRPRWFQRVAGTSQETVELRNSIECLCRNVGLLAQAVGDLVAVTVAATEQQTLLRHRLDRIDGRLDRAELFLADLIRYPRAQTEIPNEDELRAWVATARKGR